MLNTITTNTILENANLQQLLDKIQENFFIADWVAKKVTYISPACLNIYGYPPENFFADHNFWFNVIHPDDQERVAKTHEQFKFGKKIEREYRIIHANGSIRWVYNTIVPTVDEKGTVIRVDGYTKDITEKKESELRINELNALIYKANHDLRGPLNAAKIYITLAAENVKDEKALAYLEKVNYAYNNIEEKLLAILRMQDKTSIVKPAVDDKKKQKAAKV
ncbi:MAG TPA: PAS domain-containing protein [Bacteroidia bacterium]|nr:PAS domain-containing protein [Bacteroidia bacterium]